MQDSQSAGEAVRDRTSASSARGSLLERYLLFWLIASSAAAFGWPLLTSRFSLLGDPFTGTPPRGLSILIATTMFAIGLLLPRDEVRLVIQRWPAVLGGTAVQYASMPLLAYACGLLFGLQGPYFVGLVLVGCVPGAMASNVLTMNARGNTSYSVSLTTCATLLSPVAVPLALSLLLGSSRQVALSVRDVSVSLLLTVVGPVIAGHLVSRRFPRLQPRVRWAATLVANIAILWIIATVVGQNRERLGQLRGDLLAALLLVNVCGYAAGWLAGRPLRLDTPMRRALTLEIGMQNAGVGAWLARELFPDEPAMAIAPALYTFGCMLTGTMLASAWNGWSKRYDKDESAAA